MKIAIASAGNTTGSAISMFFARCEYFAIYDTATEKLDFVENIYRKNKEHVGIEVANHLVRQDVKKIISGEFGTSVRSVTDPNNIQLIVIGNNQSTVQEIIASLKEAEKRK
jgi:predicted Fe-Mo cluster-binding NifX family protein